MIINPGGVKLDWHALFNAILFQCLWFSVIVFGPLSYLAGRRFEMIEFTSEAVLLMSLGWATIGYVCIDRMRQEQDEKTSINTHQE